MGDQNYTFRVALANPGYTHRLYPTANRGHTLARVDASTKASYRKEIGRRLKRARQKAGIATQAQAAERLGEALSETIEPSRIGNYEQGIRTPDPLTMKVLCEIYGAYPSYIYGFDEGPQDETEFVLLQKYRMTDDRGRRAIQGIAEHQPAYQAGVTTRSEKSKLTGT